MLYKKSTNFGSNVKEINLHIIASEIPLLVKTFSHCMGKTYVNLEITRFTYVYILVIYILMCLDKLCLSENVLAASFMQIHMFHSLKDYYLSAAK